MGHFDTSGLEDAGAALVEQGIDVVRIGYSDLIGTERGRDVLVNRFARTVGDGVAFCRSVYGTTPMGDVVHIEGGVEAGLPDVVAFPDLSTMQAVPWEPGVAHCIADVFNPDGSASEESPRSVLRRVIDQFAELGMRPIVGPELEFFVLERDASAPTGWRRYGEATGNVYVAGLKGDPENILLRALRQLSALRAGRRGRQPRVLQRPVRDQPLALRRAGRRRPGVPLQDADQGARPAERQAGDVHGQAVQRRGRLGLPPPLLHVERRRAAALRRPDGEHGLSKTGPAADRRGARPRACARRHAATRRSTPTSGSARTRWRPG